MAAKQQPPTLMEKFRSYESELSTVFGFVVVVVIGVLLLFFLRKATLKQTPELVDLGASTENLMNGQKEQTKTTGSYTVKAGDHLWKIAEEQMGDGYQWTTLARANSIRSPYVVREGQSLTIPSPDPKVAEVKSEKKAATITEAKQPEVKLTTPTGEYIVKTGDNLWKIAVAEYKDGYKWVEIYRANKQLIGKNPGIIKAGQKFVMPSSK